MVKLFKSLFGAPGPDEKSVSENSESSDLSADEINGSSVSPDLIELSMTVNGKKITREVEGRRRLVEFLREDLRLTGTHVACDTSQCGACTIHLDGLPVKSCAVLACQADGSDIVTIEGLADGDELHPMQEAFRENHGLQCGFCTPGMVMSAIGLVNDNSSPSEEEIRHHLEGNICRCTGYHNIVKSISAGAQAMKGSGDV